MTTETVLFLLGLIFVIEAIRSHYELSAAAKDERKIKELKNYPSVTVIRPIKGMDTGARQNIRVALDTGYKGEVENIFVFDGPDDPAFPIVKEEITDLAKSGEPVNAKIIFSGEPPKGRTGKLNAMIAGLKQAKSGIIVFADSDTRPDKDALNKLVETLLRTPNSGSAFAMAVAKQDLKTTGDVGYAMLLNALYSPAAFLVAKKRNYSLPFIMGQYMALKKEAIEAIGGLESVDGRLVDDMYIGKLVNEAGYHNVMIPHTISVFEEGLTIEEFQKLFVKWLSFGVTGLPYRMILIPLLLALIFWVGLLIGVFALANGWWSSAILNLLAPVIITSSFNSLHRKVGGARLKLDQLWVIAGLIITAPLVFLNIFTKRKVTWRGRDYQLNGSLKLAKAGEDDPIPVFATERRRMWVYIDPSKDRRVSPQAY